MTQAHASRARRPHLALAQPFGARCAPFVACLTTVALILAGCGSGSPTAGPSARVIGSAAPQPTASPVPSVSQAPSASQAPSTSPSPSAPATPPSSVTALPSPAKEPQTIHVLEPARNVTQVSVGSLTGCTSLTACQGDYVLGDDPLLDATTRKEVGNLQFECFRVDTDSSLFHCPGNTFTLTGRGQISYTEDVHFAPGYDLEPWPITGGTGEFLGAIGFVTSPADSTYTEGGDFLITFTTPTAPPAASPAATNLPQTIHLALHSAGNSVYVPVGSLTRCTNTTSCQGDYRLGVVPLVDAATNEEVGTLVYVEFVVETGDSLFHSPGNAIRLTGRGEIVFTETLYDDGSGRPATAPITGGTGEFLGATGFVVSTSLPTGGDFVITITNHADATNPAPTATQPVTASPHPADAPQTVHLTEHPTNVNSVEVGSLTNCTDPTSCQGDYLLGESAMYDAVTGNQVGTVTFECFFIDTGSLLLHCPGSTITLTDRGQIVINEIVDLGGEIAPDNGTIIGGTGEYLGATGNVTSGNRDFVITITK